MISAEEEHLFGGHSLSVVGVLLVLVLVVLILIRLVLLILILVIHNENPPNLYLRQSRRNSLPNISGSILCLED